MSTMSMNEEQSTQEVHEVHESREPTLVSVEDNQEHLSESQDDDNEYSQSEEDASSDGGSCDESSQIGNIDLSENEFYKGLCTLLEDEQGNNILEYISLLHTELIGVNKNLRSMNKNMGTIAKCAELMVKK